ncbi:MarR family transcriptional regulator [Pediococcus pentosaceus]
MLKRIIIDLNLLKENYDEQASDINFLMRKIQIKEHQLASEVSGQYDLTETQAKTLGFIEKFPGTNQKNIADSFSLSNASTSAIIKKLVTSRFIEKSLM